MGRTLEKRRLHSRKRVIAPLAITTGDASGIGPEVIAKAIARTRDSNLLIFGDPALYLPFRKFLPTRWSLHREEDFESRHFGGFIRGTLNFVVPNPKRSSGRCIELATRAAIAKKVSAVVTGPIDKPQLHREGYRFDGHTEMLASLCKTKEATMMLAGPELRVTLATTHVALSGASRALTPARLSKTIAHTVRAIREDFGKKNPCIAVLALNPHAGDGSLFGNEERKVIRPAIVSARKRFPYAKIEGPFPADGFFSQWKPRHRRHFDAVVCMYHDQGLIPVKLLDFQNTVNVTLGLPIVRTSVDHGTGRDIAGRGIADESPMVTAIHMARQIASKRFKKR